MADAEDSVLIEEGPEPRIISLIRFLPAEYVEDFQFGHLRLGSVKSYRENYEGNPGKRNDDAEFLAHLFQPNQVVVKFNEYLITDICGPIEIRQNFEHRSYLLCMSAITDRFLNAGNGARRLSPELVKMGPKAVIVTHVNEFKRRIKEAVLKTSYLLAYPGTGDRIAKLVEYVDFNSLHGQVGPFRKSRKCEFQLEWRVAVVDAREAMAYPDHIWLEVGDISDITFVIDSSTFLESVIKATPRNGAKPIK
jgi:hypothetical protein